MTLRKTLLLAVSESYFIHARLGLRCPELVPAIVAGLAYGLAALAVRS